MMIKKISKLWILCISFLGSNLAKEGANNLNDDDEGLNDHDQKMNFYDFIRFYKEKTLKKIDFAKEKVSDLMLLHVKMSISNIFFKIEDKQKQIEDILKKRIFTLNKSLNDCQGLDNKSKLKLSNWDTRVYKKQQTDKDKIVTLEYDNKRLQEQVDNLNKLNPDLALKNQKLEDTNKLLKIEINRLKGITNTLQHEIKTSKNGHQKVIKKKEEQKLITIEPTIAQLKHLQSSIKQKDHQIQKLQEEVESLAEQIQDLKDQVTIKEHRTTQLDNTKFNQEHEHMKEVAFLKQKIIRVEDTHQKKLKEEEQKLQQEIKNLKEQIENLKEDILIKDYNLKKLKRESDNNTLQFMKKAKYFEKVNKEQKNSYQEKLKEEKQKREKVEERLVQLNQPAAQGSKEVVKNLNNQPAVPKKEKREWENKEKKLENEINILKNRYNKTVKEEEESMHKEFEQKLALKNAEINKLNREITELKHERNNRKPTIKIYVERWMKLIVFALLLLGGGIKVWYSYAKKKKLATQNNKSDNAK